MSSGLCILEAENARLKRLPAEDAPVVEAMKSLSSQYRRHTRIFRRRAGHELGVHRAHRLPDRAARRPRRRIAAGRLHPRPAANTNFLWD